MAFTSNDKYFVWTFIFLVILIVLGALFTISLVAYCRQTFVYNRFAKERKSIKRELMKIKDTEYQNFLLQESENFKRGGSVSKNINESGTSLDDSD